MNKETLKKNLREIPDFPIPGILFYDVTTLFKNAECLQGMIDELYEMYKDKGITKVVGIESRGFILGGALAARLGAGFIMARKPGKLPAEVLEETYAKEYGTDTIQIHKDAINERPACHGRNDGCRLPFDGKIRSEEVVRQLRGRVEELKRTTSFHQRCRHHYPLTTINHFKEAQIPLFR